MYDDHIIPPLDSPDFNALLREIVDESAPARFALCEVVPDDEPDGWVYAWGAALADRTVIFDAAGRIIGYFRSPEAALRLFSRVCELRLVWVDAEPSAEEPDEDE